VSAGSGDPAAAGRAVPAAVTPAADAALLGAGPHAAYRPPLPAAGYVLPAPQTARSEWTAGLVTAAPQYLGAWAQGGPLVVAGAAAGPPAAGPLLAYYDPVAGAAATARRGHLVAPADGSIAVEGGPRLDLAADALDLTGTWAQTPPGHPYGTAGAFPHAGVTGTYPIPARGDGTAGSITFHRGLYRAHAAGTPSSPMFTGTFRMYRNAHGASPTQQYLVTVEDGVVVGVEAVTYP
jgi:hypothetical protein